jgi:uncharacterized membrane protein (DUF485 family)
MTVRSNARLGLKFFAVYAAIYLTFVLLNAFAPDIMAWTPLAGINFAIWFGVGLIPLAFIMSIAYGLLCKSSPSGSDRESIS